MLTLEQSKKITFNVSKFFFYKFEKHTTLNKDNSFRHISIVECESYKADMSKEQWLGGAASRRVNIPQCRRRRQKKEEEERHDIKQDDKEKFRNC